MKMKMKKMLLSTLLLAFVVAPTNAFAYTYSDSGLPFTDKDFTYYSILTTNYIGPATSAMAGWDLAVEATYTAITTANYEIHLSDDLYGNTDWNAITSHHHLSFEIMIILIR
ncbi:hypothetical protein [Paenibacillus sp. PL91]|uniref:hypothetical protein n=1 Tax=Paenibacillus sp. PL91 TaxID=2729538 RepID=UPI00145D2BE7|nr:hypothetical protein [Paenibacillus sp. PL91]MBC9205072.1 hypothetical protein [Paenibacillus sp. PL91]